jgi:hypothetical protein
MGSRGRGGINPFTIHFVCGGRKIGCHWEQPFGLIPVMVVEKVAEGEGGTLL